MPGLLEAFPPPLDGDGDGIATVDMGAFEYDRQTADSNGDQIPDWWYLHYSLDPNDPVIAAFDPDYDDLTTGEEWIADTDPTDPQSCFRIEGISIGPPVSVHFMSSSNRNYTLFGDTNLNHPAWMIVPGQVNIPGRGGPDSLSDTNAAAKKIYQINVELL